MSLLIFCTEKGTQKHTRTYTHEKHHVTLQANPGPQTCCDHFVSSTTSLGHNFPPHHVLGCSPHGKFIDKFPERHTTPWPWSQKGGMDAFQSATSGNFQTEVSKDFHHVQLENRYYSHQGRFAFQFCYATPWSTLNPLSQWLLARQGFAGLSTHWK